MCCIIPSPVGKYRRSFKRHQKEFLAPLPGRIFNIYQVRNHKPHLLTIYIICQLPLVFLSPTSPKIAVLFASTVFLPNLFLIAILLCRHHDSREHQVMWFLKYKTTMILLALRLLLPPLVRSLVILILLC